MAFGAFISMDTGYAHDPPAEKRREIVAVLEHFVEWCEITYDRAARLGGRDEEYALYCALDNELSALAREQDAWAEQGQMHNGVNDCEARVGSLPLEQILRSLVPLDGASGPCFTMPAGL